MAINNNPIDILQDQKWEPIPWKKLQVGDIVRVSFLHLLRLQYRMYWDLLLVEIEFWCFWKAL